MHIEEGKEKRTFQKVCLLCARFLQAYVASIKRTTDSLLKHKAAWASSEGPTDLRLFQKCPAFLDASCFLF